MNPILRQNLRGAAAMALCLPFLLPLAAACVSTPDGLRLTAPAEAGFVAAELELCDVFEPLAAAALPQPLAGVATVLGPTACQGQSALLKAALDHVTAAPSPTGFPSMAPPTHPLVRTSRGYAVWAGTIPLGYVPDARTARLIHTPQVQMWLAGLADGGARAQDGGR